MSYKDPDGIERENYVVGYAENTQDCAAFAKKVEQDRFSYSRAVYWTYRAETNGCGVMFNNSEKSAAEGRVSGSSDCSIPAPGINCLKISSSLTFCLKLELTQVSFAVEKEEYIPRPAHPCYTGPISCF